MLAHLKTNLLLHYGLLYENNSCFTGTEWSERGTVSFESSSECISLFTSSKLSMELFEYMCYMQHQLVCLIRMSLWQDWRLRSYAMNWLVVIVWFIFITHTDTHRCKGRFFLGAVSVPECCVWRCLLLVHYQSGDALDCSCFFIAVICAMLFEGKKDPFLQLFVAWGRNVHWHM